VYVEEAGYPCSNDNECVDDHVCAYWNDRTDEHHPYGDKRCCPTSNWVQISPGLAAWCSELEIGDACVGSNQCKSGKCKPGGTVDSVCV